MTIDAIIAGLRERGALGLDLSPGDEICAEAAELLWRWHQGRFTPEEIHNFCHNLHGTVSAEDFARGCMEEQRKLYGFAPCLHQGK